MSFENQIVETKHLTEEQKFQVDYKPVVTYFQGINSEIMGRIITINGLQRSKCKLFDEFFYDECKKSYDKNDNQAIKVNTIITETFPNTLERWEMVANKIETGKIRLV